MHVNIYDVFYSQCSHQLASVATAAILRAMLLLQEYKSTNLVSCVTVTHKQLKIIIISLKLYK